MNVHICSKLYIKSKNLYKIYDNGNVPHTRSLSRQSMDTRRGYNRRKPSSQPSHDTKVKVANDREKAGYVRPVRLRPTMQLPMSDQICYHWLFAIEFQSPIHHAILPFSEPIAQEMNN